jgi:hypothetical protein
MTEREENILNGIIANLPFGGAEDIANRLGLGVRFAAWHPVTAGEILHDLKEIVVNENAQIPAEQVIAHELGHFFVREHKIVLVNEEAFCDRFAKRLLKLKAVQ